MRTLRGMLRRIAGLFVRQRQDADFAAELDSHFALDTEDGIRAGLTPAEARPQALIRLGGIENLTGLITTDEALSTSSISCPAIVWMRRRAIETVRELARDPNMPRSFLRPATLPWLAFCARLTP